MHSVAALSTITADEFKNKTNCKFYLWIPLKRSDVFMSLAGAFNAFDKDGDGIIKLNVLEVSQF